MAARHHASAEHSEPLKREHGPGDGQQRAESYEHSPDHVPSPFSSCMRSVDVKALLGQKVQLARAELEYELQGVPSSRAVRDPGSARDNDGVATLANRLL
jgi:hypothetical protein